MEDLGILSDDDFELHITTNWKHALTDGRGLIGRQRCVSIHDRIHTGCCRKRKTRFVVFLQHTRKHHTRRGRVRRQVPTHSVSILENDTVCRLGSVICIDTLVLDERHVKWSVNVQTVLLRKEDILRHEIGTKHRWARRNVQGHQTVLFAVELTVTAIRVCRSRKVRWRRWCGRIRWSGRWRECGRGTWRLGKRGWPRRCHRRRSWNRGSGWWSGWVLRLWNTVTPFYPTTTSKTLVSCPARQRDLVHTRKRYGRIVDDWLIHLSEYVIRVRKGASREVVAMDEVELIARGVGKASTHFHSRFQGSHRTLCVRLRAGDGDKLCLDIVLRAERRLNRGELGLQSSGNGRLIAF